MSRLLLASSSPYRRAILDKLNLDYECASPDIDESQNENESPFNYVSRLAEAKAHALSTQYPDSLIIGSDQCAIINDRIIGKPGNFDNACEQLQSASGQSVTFLTAICLLNTATNNTQICVEPFHVHFRQLTQEMIENYLNIEQPYNCAGSFKSEGMGIALFDRLEGDDPNTLIGLPLIRLIRMLESEGVKVI